jgi:hypothetical protein
MGLAVELERSDLVFFQPLATSPWKHHSTLVIPSAAQRSRGTCSFFSVRPIRRILIKVTAPLVIPSEAEFPATLFRDTTACAVFRRRKPHALDQRHQDQQEIRQAEGPAVRPSPKQLPAALSATIYFPMEAPLSPLSSRGADLPVSSKGSNDTARSPWMQGPEGRPPNVSPARKGWDSIPRMICLPRRAVGAP